MSRLPLSRTFCTHTSGIGSRGRGHRRRDSAFSEQDIIAIRASQLTGRELAAQYGVNPETIRSIRREIAWKDLATGTKPMRDCAWCDTPISPTRHRQTIYCSPQCKSAATRAKTTPEQRARNTQLQRESRRRKREREAIVSGQ